MCTLTYIPNNTGGFLLTSNRDESVLREPAFAPAIYEHAKLWLMYPKDPQGGGTWLATSSNHFTLCLLNGAFGRHVHNPPYKHSRGLVVTQFFEYNDVNQFVAEYSFTDIEPFTLVIIHQQSKPTIYELRWDGKEVYIKTVDAEKPQIWSSAMLYEPAVITEREKWFSEFLAVNPQPQLPDMLNFHHFGGKGDAATNVLMNRNNILRTISITAIEVRETGTYMHYEDLISSTLSVCNLPVDTNQN
ncbi:MAG: NRDE family protein [Bacteroidota bacterium]